MARQLLGNQAVVDFTLLIRDVQGHRGPRCHGNGSLS